MPRAMRWSQLSKTGNRRLPELIIDVLSPHHEHLNQRACGRTITCPSVPSHRKPHVTKCRPGEPEAAGTILDVLAGTCRLSRTRRGSVSPDITSRTAADRVTNGQCSDEEELNPQIPPVQEQATAPNQREGSLEDLATTLPSKSPACGWIGLKAFPDGIRWHHRLHVGSPAAGPS
jgi:hypothetical protein